VHTILGAIAFAICIPYVISWLEEEFHDAGEKRRNR
jgi:hypothetical protein